MREPMRETAIFMVKIVLPNLANMKVAYSLKNNNNK
jgi:hypothetical protein